MQNSRGGLSVTDTAVNRESGWVGFVDIIMRLAKSSVSPTQPARLGVGRAETMVAHRRCSRRLLQLFVERDGVY